MTALQTPIPTTSGPSGPNFPPTNYGGDGGGEGEHSPEPVDMTARLGIMQRLTDMAIRAFRHVPTEASLHASDHFKVGHFEKGEKATF